MDRWRTRAWSADGRTRLQEELGNADAWCDAFLSRAGGSSLRGHAAYAPQALRALADQHILVVGGGAVGGRTLQRLVTLGAGTGRGHLKVYDPDVVEVSNLQRQCGTALDAGPLGAGTGHPKVAALVDPVDERRAGAAP